VKLFSASCQQFNICLKNEEGREEGKKIRKIIYEMLLYIARHIILDQFVTLI